ncbi:MAG TPA: Uma2 family endonuclease [Bryobacteraceae bacterium]|jgi:Uma2 family endonuclease|nr:Uma2 family endonuclease [Bryobacteraceae bacterium]
MSAATLIPVEEYLQTSYSPDREYRDGVLLERNLGDKSHAGLQALLTIYIGNRRKQWNIQIYTELRIKVREKWFPIPDVCVYELPGFEGRYPDRPPLLWIEILSYDDRMVDVWAKAAELIDNGVPYVWIIDPNTLWSELRTANGFQSVPENTLRIPGTPIVIPLAEVVEA